jgi:hypothetical protein
MQDAEYTPEVTALALHGLRIQKVRDSFVAAKRIPRGTPEAHAGYLRLASEIRSAYIEGATWRDIAVGISTSQTTIRQLLEWSLSAQYEQLDSQTQPEIAIRVVTQARNIDRRKKK